MKEGRKMDLVMWEPLSEAGIFGEGVLGLYSSFTAKAELGHSKTLAMFPADQMP